MRAAIAVFLLLLSGAAAPAPAPAPAPASSDRIVILNKSDDTATIFETETGKAVATIPVGHGPHEAAVLSDGRTCAVSDYGDREKPGRTVTLLDVDKGTKIGAIELPPGARPHGLAPLHDGRLLVTAEGLKELLVVDPKAGRVEQRIPTFQDVSHMVVSTPDGARAFVANIGSGSVTVVEGRKAIRQIPTGKGAEGIAITPDGRQVWVANREADTVSVIDARSLDVIGEVAAAAFPIRVKITPDGKRALVSCASSGEVAVFDTATRRPIGRIAIVPGEKPEVVGLLVAPDNRRAWVAAVGADFVAALDLEKLAVVGRLVAGRGPDGMAGAFR